MHSLEAREQGEGTIGVWLIHSWLLGASKIPSLPLKTLMIEAGSPLACQKIPQIFV
jgi:hypothetical protein